MILEMLISLRGLSSLALWGGGSPESEAKSSFEDGWVGECIDSKFNDEISSTASRCQAINSGLNNPAPFNIDVDTDVDVEVPTELGFGTLKQANARFLIPISKLRILKSPPSPSRLAFPDGAFALGESPAIL